MEMSTFFNIRAKDGAIPRVLALLCFPELTYLVLQKGDKHIVLEQYENFVCVPTFSSGIILT